MHYLVILIDNRMKFDHFDPFWLLKCNEKNSDNFFSSHFLLDLRLLPSLSLIMHKWSQSYDNLVKRDFISFIYYIHWKHRTNLEKGKWYKEWMKQAQPGNNASGLRVLNLVLKIWYVWRDRWTIKWVTKEALKKRWSIIWFSIGSHRKRKEPTSAVFALADGQTDRPSYRDAFLSF